MTAQMKIPTLTNSTAWNSDSQLLEVVMIRQDSYNVKTFVFHTQDHNWFDYAPGQFITLELEIEGKKVHRTYTLSSSPSRPLCITITVKSNPDGFVSKWLHENLKVGDKVKAFGPAGIFTLHNHMADKYLFLSGGVGVTPVMSMARWIFDYGLDTDTVFVQCNQTPSDILFRKELEGMSARIPDMKVAFVCERPDEYGAWTGFTGRLNQLMLELIAPDYMEREIFCCGPEPYMQAVRDILNAAGYDMERYHEESFTSPVETEADIPDHDDIIIDDSNKSRVTFAKTGKEIEVTEGTTLLNAAKAAGIHIPNACQFGVCGTCKVKKISGDVHMVQNGGINDADVEAGYILACCSNPLGEVEIDY
ncbi:MAG: hybrid-cluster NAD(P)-dependent oxidoreductase [Alphaproteobacteria bacterium]|nr:hybrid-cluster NAD(P)-dependent oxidoreductase [Alphaproteobacteria bacterium]